MTYTQDSGNDDVYPPDYGDDMSKYTWVSYLANGGERTGHSDGPAPDTATDDNLLWDSSAEATIGGNIAPGGVAIDGKVIVARSTGGGMFGGGTGPVIALNATTGALIWESADVSLGSSFSTITLFAFPSDYFFVASGGFGTGGLTMMDANTGDILWTDSTINPGAVYHPALWVPEDDLYMLYGPVSSTDADVAELFPELDTNQYVEVGWNLSEPEVDRGPGGRRVWGHVMDHGGNPQLCYGDGKVYMGEYSGWGVYALDARTGDYVWRVNRKDAAGYAAVYGDGKLFVHCQSVHCTAINTTTGAVIWEESSGLANRAYAVWHGCYAYGRVYWHDLGMGLTGATKCFDADTGEKLWSSLTVSMIGYYQLCVAGGKVYGQMSDGSTTTGRDVVTTAFGCWDAFTGELLWTLDGITCNVPMVAYGNLYLFYSNKLVCYGPSDALPPAAPEPWSMWRGNTENPGVFVGETAPINLSLGPTWVFTMDAGTSSSPAVADGKVFIGSTDKNIYCIDVETGAKIWNRTIGARVYSSPAYAYGRVYTGADDGKFYCLNAENGSIIKTVNDGDGSYISFNTGLGQMQIRSSPIIYGDKIFVGGATGNIYCFDLDLNPIWSHPTSGYVAGSAAIEGNYVYIFSTNNNLYKFDLQGNLVFERYVETTYRTGMFAMGQPWSTTPVVNGEHVFCGVGTAHLVCVNATNGDPIWDEEQPDIASETSHGSPTYFDGVVYAPAGPTTAAANAVDGVNIWSAWGSWEIFCSTIVVSDQTTGQTVVYIGSEAGSMTCLNASDGLPVSWYTTGGNLQSTPAVYDGKLIFGSADNNVYCFANPSDKVIPTIDVSLNRDTLYVDTQDSVTITAQLNPGIPCVDLFATLIKPDGLTVIDLDPVATDIKGKATFTYPPDEVGNWTIMASWSGADNWQGAAYPAAYSEQLTLTALVTPDPLVATVVPEIQTISPGDLAILSASATGGTPEYSYQWYNTVDGVGVQMDGETSRALIVVLPEPNVYGYYCEVTDSVGVKHSSETAEVTVVVGGVSMELIFAVVGVVAVVVIVVIAYMYLKKRK